MTTTTTKKPTKQDIFRKQKAKLQEFYLRQKGEHQLANNSFKMSRQINTFLEDSWEQGFSDMGALNKMVAHQIANQAIVYEDKDLLGFIGEIKTHGGSNFSHTVYGQDLIRKVGDKIDTELDKKDKEEWDSYVLNRTKSIEALDIQIGQAIANDKDPEEFYTLLEKMGRHHLATQYRNRDKNVKAGEVLEKKVTFSGKHSTQIQTLQDKYEEGGVEGYMDYKLDNGLSVDPEVEKTILNSIRQPRVRVQQTNEYIERFKNINDQLDTASGEAQTMMQKLQEQLSGKSVKVPESYWRQKDLTSIKITDKIRQLYDDIHEMDGEDDRAGYKFWSREQSHAYDSGIRAIADEILKEDLQILSNIIQKHRESVAGVEDYRTNKNLKKQKLQDIVYVVSGRSEKKADLNPKVLYKRFLGEVGKLGLGSGSPWLTTFFPKMKEEQGKEVPFLDREVDTPLEEWLERRLQESGGPDVELYGDMDHVSFVHDYLQHMKDLLIYEIEKWNKNKGVKSE